MVSYVPMTSATAHYVSEWDQATPNTPNVGKTDYAVAAATTVSKQRIAFQWRTPAKPASADALYQALLVLTQRSFSGWQNGTPHSLSIRQISKPGYNPRSASWNFYSGATTAFGTGEGNSWATAGGEGAIISTVTMASANNGSSFAWDVTAITPDFDKTGSAYLRFTQSSMGYPVGFIINKGFYGTLFGGTAAWRPLLRITYRDDPPAKVNISLAADTSLTDASYTNRRRIRIAWDASTAADFYRYRIRSGANRTSATNLTTKALVYTRSTTSYIDQSVYTDGSTIYYTIYAEDQNNTTAGTTATRSDVTGLRIPWTPTVSVTSSASVLDLVTVNTTVRDSHAGSKIVWGDGSTSFTRTQDTTGSFYTATHRYTRATAVVIRVQNESSAGIRSGFTNTSRTIGGLNPVAKMFASPTVQRTGATFQVGNASGAVGPDVGGSLFILNSLPAAADGVGTRVRFRVGASLGSVAYMLVRPESGGYRVIYYEASSLGTALADLNRDIQWKITRGDMFALRVHPAAAVSASASTALVLSMSWSSTAFTTVGDFIPAYRLSRNVVNSLPVAGIKTGAAITNPVLFSAKDSYARAANRAINRFRWVPDLRGGTFPATAASYYNTGATSFFWWGWSASTYSSVAVRAVDVSNASSINSAPVFVSTEATFRIPDDLRDPVIHMDDKRERLFAHEAILGADYGVLDIGNIGPRSIDVNGRAYTQSSTTNELIDIIRISDVFRQRKRVFVVSPNSAATAVQGYIIDEPVTMDGESPLEKRWRASVRVVSQ